MDVAGIAAAKFPSCRSRRLLMDALAQEHKTVDMIEIKARAGRAIDQSYLLWAQALLTT